MPKVKISEYSATANSNTDVASINIDEGCAPSGINNAIRAVMGHLKDFQQGTYGDPFNGPVNGTLGATTASTANVTTLTTSSTVTHNGGTANGVAYLNGSKVLTTGSALVFDGTNLGLGVTPLSSGNGVGYLEMGNGGVIGARGGSLQIGSNVYATSGTFKYASSNYATLLSQISGAYYFGIAPSGTAGNAISFTTAMTLDASGNLGVGVTSPVSRIDARSPSSVIANYQQIQAFSTDTSAAIDLGGGIGLGGFYNSTQIATFGTIVGRKENSTSGNYAGYLAFGTNAQATGVVERMRIDSSGNLLVGGTGYTNKRVSSIVPASWTGNVFYGEAQTSFTGGVYVSATATAAGTGWYHMICQSSGATNNLLIYGNGNVVNANNSYGPISDIKVKENITDTTPKLNKLMQVRVVNYNLKGELGYETHSQIGVIAQELETVFPNLVEENSDRDADGNDLGTTTKSVKMSVFVPMLIKAMQEQQALIIQLTARITALEGA